MRFLRGAPRPVVETLRALRSTFLRAAGPLERTLGAGSEESLPPLWLRRHTGRLSDISAARHGMEEIIEELALVCPGSSVVDAGCGFGVMAPPLSAFMGPEGRYLGFDIHGPSIRWAQRFLGAVDRRYRFVLIRREAQFPVAEREADFVLAKSLFTHLTESAARRAFQEIARVLAPRGRALVTAFLFEADRAPHSLFPYPRGVSPVRWRWKGRPEAAIAFERVHFTRLLQDAGLTVDLFRPGFWPRADRLNAQDVLVLRRADAETG